MLHDIASSPASTAPLVPPGGPAAALYANYFEIGHNPFEFLLELGQFRAGAGSDPGAPGAIAIHTRIATTPTFAKMFLALLQRAVAEHEAAHGEIAGLTEPPGPFEKVLHSLPEFESRAARLRMGASAPSAPSDPLDDR